MMKNKKAQIVAILSNPVVLLIILVVTVLFFAGSGLLAILSTFEYAGLTWADSGTIKQDCNVGGGDTSLSVNGETFSISGRGDTNSFQRYAETDLKGLDEVLIIYEGSASAYSGRDYSAGGAIYASIVGTDGGEVRDSKNAQVEKSNSASQDFKTFPPSIWKFRNNFDGTWSSLQSIGVGDVFIEKSRGSIQGTPKLRIGISAGVGCGNNDAGSTANIKVYNIVGKENSFAICKADQFLQDKNQDGKFTTDECVDLKTIVLNSEEAIKESYDAKFERLQAELEAKQNGLVAQNDALQAQIDALRAQSSPSSQIDALTAKLEAQSAELKETRQRLDDVEAKDRNVVAVIENEEAFKQPSAIKQLWNRILAWIKNLI